MGGSGLGWDGMPGMEGMSTDEAIGDWTDADWADWFSEVVKPSDEWAALKLRHDEDGTFLFDDRGLVSLTQPGSTPARLPGDLPEGLVEITTLIANSFGFEPLVPMLTAPSMEGVFSRMSYENKKRFFEGWYAMKERKRRKQRLEGGDQIDTPLGGMAPSTPGRSWINITLPNGNVVTIPTGGPDEPKGWESEDVSAEAPLKKRRTAVIAAGGAAVIVVAVSLIIAQLTGSDDSPTTTAAAVAADTPTSSLGAVSQTTATPAVVPAPSTTLGGCAASAQAADHSMTFSSPDFADGTIPESWAGYYSEQNGFPTPSFEIGGVPAGTTELAIVILNVPESAQDEVAGATELWTTSVPQGRPHWILTGISPDTATIPATAEGEGLPVGMVAQDHNSYGAGVPGNVEYNKFLGPHSGEMFLFTLFAMCEPEGDWYSPSNLAWMRGWAIDRVWFTAEAGF
jgi:phosphatidylethanolamine-binding protein (PEBP) family uncharacterized protein